VTAALTNVADHLQYALQAVLKSQIHKHAAQANPEIAKLTHSLVLRKSRERFWGRFQYAFRFSAGEKPQDKAESLHDFRYE